MRSRCSGIFSSIVLLAAISATAIGASSHTERADRPDPDAGREYFTDVALVDQDGRSRRLYSDLLKDRVVIISAMFTGCEGVCPVTMGKLVAIQKWLGPRLGQDVLLLSLTVDRNSDSPGQLKQYADKLAAKPGWYFLTGEPENIDFALRKLGLWVSDRDSHSPVFLVGNVPTGLWKKAQGLASTESLIHIVESVLDDRLQTNPDEVVKGPR